MSAQRSVEPTSRMFSVPASAPVVGTSLRPRHVEAVDLVVEVPGVAGRPADDDDEQRAERPEDPPEPAVARPCSVRVPRAGDCSPSSSRPALVEGGGAGLPRSPAGPVARPGAERCRPGRPHGVAERAQRSSGEEGRSWNRGGIEPGALGTARAMARDGSKAACRFGGTAAGSAASELRPGSQRPLHRRAPCRGVPARAGSASVASTPMSSGRSRRVSHQ